MKKRILSIALTLCMLMTFLPTAVFAQSDTAKKITAYSVGDTFEFGYYPQSKVTDEATIKALNDKVNVDATSAETVKTSTSVANGWVSYGYYSGTGKPFDGKMTAGDWMRYTDVVYNGNKYRGVIFDSYRPLFTGAASSANYSIQDDNGYNPSTVYWFKYEPIKWRVLDPASGMVMSETILDSQAFNNYIIEKSDEYYGEIDGVYANNYEKSSIREWLNDDFYNTAFSTSQKNMIATTTLDNSAYDDDYSKYSSDTTEDKIYLLSYADALKTSYGFISSTDSSTTRTAQSSDYAKSQGLSVSTASDYIGNSWWWLRSPGSSSEYTFVVYYDGDAYYEYYVESTDSGIRPAMNFKTDVEIVQKPLVKEKIGDYGVGDTLEYGWYPQSKVTDTDLISALNTKAGVDSDDITASTSVANGWTSYGYCKGSGTWYDGKMEASDYTRYIDVTYSDGNKYRGVVFDSYMPPNIGYKSPAGSNSYQQANGYNASTVYWFKYEPITWRVLDPATGLVMSETLLDSQAFNNYIIRENGQYYGDADKSYAANDYENSSVRKWLNDDFKNSAFSSSQKAIITAKNLGMKTTDQIYLLSADEAGNISYGFSSDTARAAQGSDYAKSLGLWVYGGNSSWLLRSVGTCFSNYDYAIYRVQGNGSFDSYYGSYVIGAGIRPVMNFKTDVEIVQKPLVKEKIGDYGVGDTLEYGWYPQSEVTDEATIKALNDKVNVDTTSAETVKTSTSLANGWTSYGYYSGTSDYDGQMTASDYMRYTDVFYGDYKYRGVIFDNYRPYTTGYASSSNEQSANGYSTGTVYWFKYEPITWRVLDPATGMVMSETILDSQEYNNYVIKSGDEYYGDKQLKYTDADGKEKDWFANNYEKSSIRKWLNDDFYNTAFSTSQKNMIATTTLDNSAYTPSRSKYDSDTTKDKIYLLSYADTFKTSYGFSSSTTASTTRTAQGSDYAKSQGLWVSTSSYSGSSYWRLRSAGRNSGIACRVGGGGSVGYNCVTDGTFSGIRPAFNFNTTSAITQSKVSEIGFANYTVETYTMNTSGTYEKTSENVLTGNYKSTAKAEYTVPTGFNLNETKSVLSGTISADGSLVLKVYLDRNKYKLTTVVDGESTPTEYYYGQTVSAVANPTKAGYKFDGWSSEIPETMPANNLTVTAKFTEKGGYVVAFNTDGGNEIDVKDNVKWNDKVLDKVSTPVKAGFTFVGWTAFRSGGKAVTENTTYGDIDTHDNCFGITIYANWIDSENPVITGIEEGGTYCDGITFTVSDNVGIASVTANGNAINPDESGKYTLEAANGEVKVVVTDLEGNTQSVTVTVNDHHYCIGRCKECGQDDPNASVIVKVLRFVIDLLVAIVKFCCLCIKEASVSIFYWIVENLMSVTAVL